MICLRCGHCCQTMSPFGPECPHLSMINTVVTCDLYPTCHPASEDWEDKRPAVCKKHDYPARICPIGKDVLRYDDGDIARIAERGCECNLVDKERGAYYIAEVIVVGSSANKLD